MEGRKLYTESRVPVRPDSKKYVLLEDELIVHKFLGLYKADPSSGVREMTLQFIAREGGFRTVRVKDIVRVR